MNKFVIFLVFLIALMTVKVVSDVRSFRELTQVTVIATHEPTPNNPTSVPFSSEKLMTLINKWRVSQGLQPYTESTTTCTVAKIRLQETQENWSHDGFVEAHNKYAPQSYMSENLSRDSSSEQITLQDWILSPSHFDNLKKDYPHSCLKCENGFCVDIFSNI
jgi:uncharacterized protein YkwD